MTRVRDFVPQGVIPAVLLPFHEDFSIDERSFRSHLRDVASVQGLSAITVNAHSTEVASCTFEEQRRVLDVAQDEVGDRRLLQREGIGTRSAGRVDRHDVIAGGGQGDQAGIGLQVRERRVTPWPGEVERKVPAGRVDHGAARQDRAVRLPSRRGADRPRPRSGATRH